MPVLSLDAVSDLAHGALTRCGASDTIACSVARAVMRAEADGIRSVGLGYQPIYLAHLRSGKVDGRAAPVVDRPRPATITVDAMHGFAHPAFDAGLPALVATAREAGPGDRPGDERGHQSDAECGGQARRTDPRALGARCRRPSHHRSCRRAQGFHARDRMARDGVEVDTPLLQQIEAA